MLFFILFYNLNVENFIFQSFVYVNIVCYVNGKQKDNNFLDLNMSKCKNFHGGYFFKKFVGTPKGNIVATERIVNWEKIAQSSKEWENLSIDVLKKIIQESHFPLPLDQDVKGFVIRALESHPFRMSATHWIQGRWDDAVIGLQILQKLFVNCPIYIGCDSSDSSFYKKMEKAIAPLDKVFVYRLKAKYPQELDELLYESMVRVSLPAGGKPSDVGYYVLNIEDLLAIHDAVVVGKPYLERMVFLYGNGFTVNFGLKLTMGTPLKKALEPYFSTAEEVRLLEGNALTGEVITEETLVKHETRMVTCLKEDRRRGFLFFLRPGFFVDSFSRTFASWFVPTSRKLDTNLHGEERPCIQCSYCENVCPRSLLPNLMHRYCSHEMEEEALAIGMRKCLDCKLCSYVCPSKIEKNFKAIVEKLDAENDSKQ